MKVNSVHIMRPNVGPVVLMVKFNCERQSASHVRHHATDIQAKPEVKRSQCNKHNKRRNDSTYFGKPINNEAHI